METPPLDPHDLELHGGHPALDFVNTIDPRTGPLPHSDYLDDFDATVRWAVHAGMLDGKSASRLAAAGAADPRGARAAWAAAVELREALHRTVVGLVAGEAPNETDLASIAGADAGGRLVPCPGAPAKGEPAARLEPPEASEPEDLLALLAGIAIDLLTTADATRLRICPGGQEGCGWAVLDSTRNRSRRWCDMGACGSAVKSARLTERRRASRGEAGS